MKPRQYMFFLAPELLLEGIAPHSLSAQQSSVNDHILSQAEAKELARSASTPEDYLKLAAYLRDQARQ
jgi:hypothetical protein